MAASNAVTVWNWWRSDVSKRKTETGRNGEADTVTICAICRGPILNDGIVLRWRGEPVHVRCPTPGVGR